MKVLEDTLSRLEARLLELEKPKSSTPSVVLHDPYQAHNTQSPSTSPPVFHADSPTVFSPFFPTSTSPSGMHWQNFFALEANTESTGLSGSSSSDTARHQVAAPYLGIEVCLSILSLCLFLELISVHRNLLLDSFNPRR